MDKNFEKQIWCVKRIVNALRDLGVSVETDYQFGRIENVLRQSWYVWKVKQLGHTHCCHINLSTGGFLAVLEDCTVMSGANIMLSTAIEDLSYEFDPSFWTEFFSDYDFFQFEDETPQEMTLQSDWKIYSEDEDCENYLLTTTEDGIFDMIEKFIIIKEEEEEKKQAKATKNEDVYVMLPF